MRYSYKANGICSSCRLNLNSASECQSPLIYSKDVVLKKTNCNHSNCYLCLVDMNFYSIRLFQMQEGQLNIIPDVFNDGNAVIRVPVHSE